MGLTYGRGYSDKHERLLGPDMEKVAVYSKVASFGIRHDLQLAPQSVDVGLLIVHP